MGNPSNVSISEVSGPKGLPLLGNIRDLRKGPLHATLERWAQEYGDIYRIKVGTKPVFVISDTKLIHSILKERPQTYRRREVMERAARSLGIEGLFTADGTEWERHRAITVQSLEESNVRTFFPTIQHIVSRLEDKWTEAAKQQQEVHVLQDVKGFATDVSSSNIFGYDLNTLEQPDGEMKRHLAQIFPLFHRRINSHRLTPWKYVPRFIGRPKDTSLTQVSHLFLTLIKETRQEMSDDADRANNPQNIMEGLITYAQESGEELPDNKLLSSLFSIFIASVESVANTLAWTIYFLASRPEAAELLDAEISSSRRQLTYQETKNLPTIDAMLNESMRLKPVAPMISVQSKEPVNLWGNPLKKGSILLLLPRVKATADTAFTSAGDFQPGRWFQAVERSDDWRHCPNASMPFGSGPRQCPGQVLALTQMRTALAMFSRRFKATKPRLNDTPGEQYTFLMRPEEFNLSLSLRP